MPKKNKKSKVLIFPPTFGTLCVKIVVLVVTCVITATVHRTQHRLRLPTASFQPQALVFTQSSVGLKCINCDWRGSCVGAITIRRQEKYVFENNSVYFNIPALEAHVGHLRSMACECKRFSLVLIFFHDSSTWGLIDKFPLFFFFFFLLRVKTPLLLVSCCSLVLHDGSEPTLSMVASSQPNVHERRGVPELLSTQMYLFSIVLYLGFL